jgi:ribosomal protein S27AE
MTRQYPASVTSGNLDVRRVPWVPISIVKPHCPNCGLMYAKKSKHHRGVEECGRCKRARQQLLNDVLNAGADD